MKDFLFKGTFYSRSKWTIFYHLSWDKKGRISNRGHRFLFCPAKLSCFHCKKKNRFRGKSCFDIDYNEGCRSWRREYRTIERESEGYRGALSGDASSEYNPFVVRPDASSNYNQSDIPIVPASMSPPMNLLPNVLCPSLSGSTGFTKNHNNYFTFRTVHFYFQFFIFIFLLIFHTEKKIT